MHIFNKKSTFHLRYKHAEYTVYKYIYFLFLSVSFYKKKGIRQEPLSNWRDFMMVIQIDITNYAKDISKGPSADLRYGG